MILGRTPYMVKEAPTDVGASKLFSGRYKVLTVVGGCSKRPNHGSRRSRVIFFSLRPTANDPLPTYLLRRPQRLQR
jgi:hypothetical protein